jgi:GNAT superfamily N-acetyltransferase
VFVTEGDPDSADARILIAELSAALAAMTGDGGQSSFDARDVRVAGAAFLLARDAHGQLLGCAALRPIDERTGEVKRMYARPHSHAGAALLAALEERARTLGYMELRLSTRRVNTRAVAFYEKHGFRAIANYGHYVGRAQSICMGKELVVAFSLARRGEAT